MRWLVSLYLVAVTALTGCGDADPILGPDTERLPLTLENLSGRWEETARIYHKLGVQTGVLIDTVRVAASEQAIYEFDRDGTVRRVRPNPGEAVIDIQPSGESMSWVIGEFESYGTWLSATRLSLNDGSTHPHVYPKDDFPTSSDVVRVFVRAMAP